jgi:hypothetical protein
MFWNRYWTKNTSRLLSSGPVWGKNSVRAEYGQASCELIFKEQWSATTTCVCSDLKTRTIITSVKVICDQDCDSYSNKAAIKKIINCNKSEWRKYIFQEQGLTV